MYKRILIITMAAIGLSFLASSCVKEKGFEDRVKDIVQLDSLNARMAALEARMKGINTDIATLKTAVEALQKNLYVTNVEPTTDGFKLTFSNGKTVTIKNGKDGKNAPVVGVKDSLGIYYWVLVDKSQTPADTSWILDKELNKIPVSGKDGAEIGVSEDLDTLYWVKITTNTTGAKDTVWLEDKSGNKVKAEGKDGESIFSGIDTTKTGYVVLTLASGTKIELPYKSELDKLVSRIQSVEVVPEYQDGSVGIKQSGTVTISFEVRPASLLDSIVNKVGVKAFSIQAVETKAVTKAVTYDTLEVTGAEVDSPSILTLTVSKGNLPDGFFAGTQPCNARLRISDGNTDKSSAYFPLSPVIETANCYIVSKAGTYKIKPVKGNSDESVGDVKSAKVLWESYGTSESITEGSIISTVSYSDGKITYTVTDKKGNAVIAAYDGENGAGNILWSWHIWCTDQPADQVFSKNELTMMDRNLGATSADKGQVSALGLLYQWGRKDPFLGSDAKYYDDLSENPKQAASTLTWPPAVAAGSTGESTNLSYSIKNPTTYITNSSDPCDWYCTSSDNKNDTLWKVSSGKTIYDPCPVGYRVPNGGDNGVWATAGFPLTFTFETSNKGMDFGTYTTSSVCWYPATGSRYNDDGLLYAVGSNGYYWSCTPAPTPNSTDAYNFGFYYDGEVNPSFHNERAIGRSVRCLKEE